MGSLYAADARHEHEPNGGVVLQYAVKVPQGG